MEASDSDGVEAVTVATAVLAEPGGDGGGAEELSPPPEQAAVAEMSSNATRARPDVRDTTAP
jgi:hypothetical protein